VFALVDTTTERIGIRAKMNVEHRTSNIERRMKGKTGEVEVGEEDF